MSMMVCRYFPHLFLKSPHVYLYLTSKLMRDPTNYCTQIIFCSFLFENFLNHKSERGKNGKAYKFQKKNVYLLICEKPLERFISVSHVFQFLSIF